MKKCPYCAEKIQDEAIVCRYCGRDLVQPQVVPTDSGAAGNGQSVLPASDSSPLAARSGMPKGLRILVILLAVLTGAIFLVDLAFGLTIKTRVDQDNALSTAFPPTLQYAENLIQLQAYGTSVASRSSMHDPFQANLVKILGPISGFLPHMPDDDLLSSACSSTYDDNIVVDVVFHNPYDAIEHDWSYGLLFRNSGKNYQFRLAISSNEFWIFTYGVPDEIEGNSGDLPDLHTAAGESNRLRLIIMEDRGYIYVNGEYIDTIDLVHPPAKGNVCVAIGYYGGEEMAGEVTEYDDFTIWRIEAP